MLGNEKVTTLVEKVVNNFHKQDTGGSVFLKEGGGSTVTRKRGKRGVNLRNAGTHREPRGKRNSVWTGEGRTFQPKGQSPVKMDPDVKERTEIDPVSNEKTCAIIRKQKVLNEEGGGGSLSCGGSLRLWVGSGRKSFLVVVLQKIS